MLGRIPQISVRNFFCQCNFLLLFLVPLFQPVLDVMHTGKQSIHTGKLVRSQKLNLDSKTKHEITSKYVFKKKRH
jgi:hypothetical protein